MALSGLAAIFLLIEGPSDGAKFAACSERSPRVTVATASQTVDDCLLGMMNSDFSLPRWNCPQATKGHFCSRSRQANISPLLAAICELFLSADPAFLQILRTPSHPLPFEGWEIPLSSSMSNYKQNFPLVFPPHAHSPPHSKDF